MVVRNTMPEVDVISRKRFVREFGENYRPGQHVTFLGPTGRGKTTLAGQLLIAVTRHNPDIKAVILHGKIKGRDTTIEKLSSAGKFPIVSSWPPSTISRRIRHRERNGYILRPLEKVGESPAVENRLLSTEFRRAIHSSYGTSRKNPIILVVDEAHQAHKELGLKTECEGPLTRGRPVCGEWSLLQRGRFASMLVYDQAEHVFIFHDPVRDNQQRYSEIGGVDPYVLIELSRQLKTKTVDSDGSTISQALYFRRSGDYLAIVDI